MADQIRSAVLGGTFDHFHRGHRSFLETALRESKHLTIGLVQAPFLGKVLATCIEPYSIRLASLQKFISSQNTLIVPLHDPFGTTLTDQGLDTIFVTPATNRGAIEINSRRKEFNLPPLKVITVPLTLGDDGKIISSTRIREGIIDREGRSYLKYLLRANSYSLPPSLRSIFKNPVGQVYQDLQALLPLLPPVSTIITVGDIVSASLIKSRLNPSVCVIDHRSGRRSLPHHSHLLSSAQLKNPAGTINPDFGNLFLTALKQDSPQFIHVDGEEDLLALPAILLAPLDAFVLYGLRGEGIVAVQVTEEVKLKVKSLLAKFTY